MLLNKVGFLFEILRKSFWLLLSITVLIAYSKYRFLSYNSVFSHSQTESNKPWFDDSMTCRDLMTPLCVSWETDLHLGSGGQVYNGCLFYRNDVSHKSLGSIFTIWWPSWIFRNPLNILSRILILIFLLS